VVTQPRLGGAVAIRFRFSRELAEALPSLYTTLPGTLRAPSTMPSTPLRKGKDMATRHVVIGTGLALTGLAGVGIAAVGSGAPNSVTPLQPAADTFTTQTQTVEDRTTARPAKRVRAKVRHRDDGTTEVRSITTTTPTTTTTTRGGADDGPNHDVGDDHGGRGEIEPGDDHGGRGEIERGDDHGGHGEAEAGEHHGGHGGNSGPGGGRDD
jgi:hypothetical protein